MAEADVLVQLEQLYISFTWFLGLLSSFSRSRYTFSTLLPAQSKKYWSMLVSVTSSDTGLVVEELANCNEWRVIL